MMQDTLSPEKHINKLSGEATAKNINPLQGWRNDDESNNNIDKSKTSVCFSCVLASQEGGYRKVEKDTEYGN